MLAEVYLAKLHVCGVRQEPLELGVASPEGQLGLPHHTAFRVFARTFTRGALVIIIIIVVT